VREMRERLAKSNRYQRSFKLARGGFYDIDFIAGFLLLRHGAPQGGNTLDRLEQLRAAGCLDHASCEQLRDAALLYRTTDHVIRLVTGRARPELPAGEHARCSAENLVRQVLGLSNTISVQEQLNSAAQETKALFDKLLSDSGSHAVLE
jgi:glutamine synthetase adenylyltransferase